LQAVRADHPDLPFILFTGKGSEEIASEAISAGVTDYLQKGGGFDRYEMLANRIENAVEARRASRRVSHAFQAIETAREGISILDSAGRFTFVNEGFSRLYGYDPGELIGEHWSLLYRDEDVETMEADVLSRLGDGGVWRGETVGLRADGSTFREDHSITTTDSGGLICVVRSLAEAGEDPIPAADE
jgi:PAS domain S-box-containing protein